MSLPPAGEDGWLPEGIFDSTLDEVDERFGAFKQTIRRLDLAQRLKDYLAELKKWKVADAVYVDGSFVSGKIDPNDVDLVVCAREDFIYPR